MRPLKKIVLLVFSIFISILLLGISIYASAKYINRQIQIHLVKETNRLHCNLKVVSEKKLRSAEYTSKINETPKDMNFSDNKEQEEYMRNHATLNQYLMPNNELSCNKKNKSNLAKDKYNDEAENAAKGSNGVYKKHIRSENNIYENERNLIDRKQNMFKNACADETSSDVEQINNDHKIKNTDSIKSSLHSKKESITPVINDDSNQEENKTLYVYETYINGKKIPNLKETKNIKIKRLELTVIPNIKCPIYAKIEELNQYIKISSEENNIFEKVFREFGYSVSYVHKYTNTLYFQHSIKYNNVVYPYDHVKYCIKNIITYERLYALLIYIKNYIDCFYNSIITINRDDLCDIKQIQLKTTEDIIKSNKEKIHHNNQSEDKYKLGKTAGLCKNLVDNDKMNMNENYSQKNKHSGKFEDIRMIINNDENNCVEIDYIIIDLYDVDRVCKFYKQKINDVQSSSQKKSNVSIEAKPLLNDAVNKSGTATDIPKNLKIRRQSV
ncbi:hypothetical protein COBT_002663 [Conglomerata obtusa]